MNCEVCGTALLRNGNCPGDECREARIRERVAQRMVAKYADAERDEALALALLHRSTGRRRADAPVVASASSREKSANDRSRGYARELYSHVAGETQSGNRRVGQ